MAHTWDSQSLQPFPARQNLARLLDVTITIVGKNLVHWDLEGLNKYIHYLIDYCIVESIGKLAIFEKKYQKIFYLELIYDLENKVSFWSHAFHLDTSSVYPMDR